MREALPEVVEEPWAQRVLDQMYRLWIEPAIQTRGLNLTRDRVMKAVVVMPPNGPIEVLLNDDVQLLAEAVAQRPIERGEGLTAADLVDIRHIEPAGVDPNVAWLAYVNIGGVITLEFDFRRNRQTASALLDRADEFLATARHALGEGRLGPAVENGFAAAELAVKAQMYLIVDGPTRVHHERLQWWEDWVKLGNAPSHLQALVGRLYSERPRSRYGDGVLTMSEPDVGGALEEVAELIEHARTRCAERSARPAPNDTIRLRAETAD